jgi:glutamate-ammonia-ligase adenylyltransferase
MVDMEFCTQYLQLIHAARGCPLTQNTGEALDALIAANLAPKGLLDGVRRSWRLQQNLSQLLKIALDDSASPDDEPKAFKVLLAKAGGARDYAALRARLTSARGAAHAAFIDLVRP